MIIIIVWKIAGSKSTIGLTRWIPALLTSTSTRSGPPVSASGSDRSTTQVSPPIS